MAKITTHRDPIRRAARIERRAKKRVETAMRKKLVKKMKNDASVLQFDEADALFGKRTEVKDAHDREANLEAGTRPVLW